VAIKPTGKDGSRWPPNVPLGNQKSPANFVAVHMPPGLHLMVPEAYRNEDLENILAVRDVLRFVPIQKASTPEVAPGKVCLVYC
jgi:hypothetical protein